MSAAPPIHPIDAPQNAEAIAPSIAFWCSLTVPEHSSTSEEIPHVNNAEYVRWIDRTAELATDAVGLTREMLLEANRMWFVARHEIDYRAESFEDDKLVIATWISDYSRIRATRRTLIHRPTDGKTILDASTSWAYVNLETRKLVRMEQDVIDRFPVAAPEDASR